MQCGQLTTLRTGVAPIVVNKGLSHSGVITHIYIRASSSLKYVQVSFPAQTGLPASVHPSHNTPNPIPLPYKNHLNSGAPGPSLNLSVATAPTPPTVLRTPSLASLLLLSHAIHRPSSTVATRPTPPKAAVVASAGMYLGASCARKMLEATMPMRFARGTATAVRRRRREGWGVLLLYQTSRMTDGAEVPPVVC